MLSICPLDPKHVRARYYYGALLGGIGIVERRDNGIGGIPFNNRTPFHLSGSSLFFLSEKEYTYINVRSNIY